MAAELPLRQDIDAGFGPNALNIVRAQQYDAIGRREAGHQCDALCARRGTVNRPTS